MAPPEFRRRHSFYIGLAGGNPLSHICDTSQESAAGRKAMQKELQAMQD